MTDLQKMRPHVFILILLGVGLAFIAGGIFLISQDGKDAHSPTSAGAVDLMPHKALYDIKMVSKHSGAQIVNISGQMYYEWKETCDAWSSDHHFNLLYEYADSPAMNITSDFTAYETFDGKTLHFNSRRKQDGTLFQELRGVANIAGPSEEGRAGKATYTVPEGLSFDLPAETLFPMAHTLELVKRMKSGDKFYPAVIFDGSDEEGPVAINTFIGKRITATEEINMTEKINEKLLDSPARKMRMAFFPLANDNAESDYEMDIIFHENGIVSNMLVEYKKFSVEQTLVALEEVPFKAACD